MLSARAAAYGCAMDIPIGFLDCPAWLDANGASRCGLPAEVRSRYTAKSTDGPLECAMIRCPADHWFNAPIEFLTLAAVPAHEYEEMR
jgi:hypothetical protein